MGYQTLIDRGLTLAFNQAKDLAIDAIFNKKDVATFDFSSGKMPAGKTTSSPIKVILIEGLKQSSTHNPTKKQVMFKSKNLDDITTYDSIKISTETWKIGPILSNNGFIVLAEIYKEG